MQDMQDTCDSRRSGLPPAVLQLQMLISTVHLLSGERSGIEEMWWLWSPSQEGGPSHIDAVDGPVASQLPKIRQPTLRRPTLGLLGFMQRASSVIV